MNKILKYILSICITVFITAWAVFAWNWLTASDWDTLDFTKWNELVEKISSINTLANGYVWIWTSTPENPLDVIGATDTNVVKIQSTSPNWWSSIDYIDDAWSFSMSMWVANSAQSIAGQSYIHAHWSHPLVLWHWGEAMRIVSWNNIWMWVTDPKAKLDIDWWVKISWSTCDTDHIWTMQYDSGTDSFQWCKNNGWIPIWVNLN
jgi:hypothetical protein